jgi:4-amino-4-deoxy-L-arabinose transferase-like glycosyltransferase
MLPKLRWEWAAFIAILVLASALRLGAPGTIEFKRDEAALSQLALDMARGRDFPLLGISSSVGIPNAPFNIYIMALPYLFSSDPTLATQFIGLLNSFAVALTYVLARRYFGTTAAVVAALAYAASPWGVLYSRKIWAQDLLPFFTLLTLGTGLAGFVGGKRWGQWLHLPLLVITGQIHYSAFVIIPASLYLIVSGRKRWTRAFALSFIPSLLLVMPYAIGVARAVIPNANTILANAAPTTTETDAFTPTLQGLEYAALTIAGTDIHSLAGPQRFQEYLASVPNAYPLFYVLALAALTVFVWLLVRWWQKRRVVDGVLLIWTVFPILAFSFTWTTIYPHYMIPMMPAVYMLIGIGAQVLWHKREGLWRWAFVVAAALLGAVVVLQVWLIIALLRFLYVNATPNGFGTPLGYLLPIRAEILSRQPTQILVDVGGQAVGIDGNATVWNFLLADIPDVRFVDDVTAVYAAEEVMRLRLCGLEIVTQQAELGPCFYGYGSSETMQVTRLFHMRYWYTAVDPNYFNSLIPVYEGIYSLLIQRGLRQDDFEPINAEGFTFDNGARVYGYTWDRQCLRLFWEITAPTDQNYSFAIHFVDAEDNRVANADALSWMGRYWRAGDRVIRTFCLPEVPAGIVGVNIGMYTYDGANFYNANLLDVNNTPVGQMLEIRLTAAS